jgi:hypothetical protein
MSRRSLIVDGKDTKRRPVCVKRMRHALGHDLPDLGRPKFHGGIYAGEVMCFPLIVIRIPAAP